MSDDDLEFDVHDQDPAVANVDSPDTVNVDAADPDTVVLQLDGDDEAVLVVDEGDETLLTAESPEGVVATAPEITSTVVLVGGIGERGPTGPQGEPGAAGAYLRFTQSTPATSWVIEHDLGYYPAVTVLDSAGTAVEGQVNFPAADTVVVTFSAAFSGTAHLT